MKYLSILVNSLRKVRVLTAVTHRNFNKNGGELSLEMNCEIIQGKFGGDLLYVPSEGMLYVFDGERSDGTRIFKCYQTVLTHPKKRDHLEHTKCNSTVRLLRNGKCERINKNVPHTVHPDHETLAADKKKMINMKAQCRYLRDNHPEDAHKIPNRHIFQKEISK